MNSNLAARLKKTLGTTCALATVAFGASAAIADESQFLVTVIQDAAQGRAIIDEDYEQAIDRLQEGNAEGLDAFYAANNLCVAYLKIGELALARQECDLAVEIIRTELEAGTTSSVIFPRQAKRREFLATALANRGVVQAFDGESELARADFLAAIEVRARTEQPETNLAHLAQFAALSE